MALIRPPDWPLFPGNRSISGINYPWFSYGSDFGLSQFQIRSKAGGDPRQGVSGAAHTAVETDLAEFNSANLEVIRWFLLCDCRAGVLFDDGRMGNSPGTPIGLESGVKADLTAAARGHGHPGSRAEQGRLTVDPRSVTRQRLTGAGQDRRPSLRRGGRPPAAQRGHLLSAEVVSTPSHP